MKTFLSFLFLLLILFISPVYSQDTIHVPADYTTIQAAINAAVDGDLVLVADDTYIENINFSGKAITVASHFIIDGDTLHIQNTIIDGSKPSHPDSGSVVFFISGEDTNSVLYGFTITNGTGTIRYSPYEYRGGGGIFCYNSGACIEFNRIINNSVSYTTEAMGGGINVNASNTVYVIIRENQIMDNNVSGVDGAYGGGMEIINSSGKIVNNVVSNNTCVSSAGQGNSAGMGFWSDTPIKPFVIIKGNEISYNTATGVDTDIYPAVAAAGLGMLVYNGLVLNNKITYNIVNGLDYAIGTGMMCQDVDNNTLIDGNYIANNTVGQGTCWGGGLNIYYSAPSITNNIIENNTATYGGGIYLLFADGLSVISNQLRNNSVTYGGGIYIDNSIPFVSKNLIVGNNADEAGGGLLVNYSTFLDQIFTPNQERKIKSFGINVFASEYYKKIKLEDLQIHNQNDVKKSFQENLGRNVELVNNTIVNNSTSGTIGGTAISSFNSTVKILNSIIWGNQPSSNPHIDGPAYVNYSDVEGGFTGTGNLDTDPMFVDQINFYLDPTNSPCIDAGNPDSLYNDPEDPLNPGFALWPALGTIRNDMGTYGGNDSMINSDELLGPLFRAFVERVNSVPNNQKQAIIDSFMNVAPSFPFIEENTIVYYIYQGTAGSVTVPGDANGWDQNAFPMTKLNGTIFWYREAVFEPDARLDYKFVLNGSTWILDPLNPNQVVGGFGPNSELAMPEYVQPPEIEYYPNIPHGTLHSFSFTSNILGNTRTIKVYTPPGYDSHPTYYYPVMLLHDGLEYITLGSANNIIDYLLSEVKINPIIAVCVPPVNRDDEYAFNLTQQFESFIVNELMPHIDSTYRTKTEPQYRAMAGLSFGGLITTQICYNNPESFGLSAPYSPAYWPKEMEVFDTVLGGQKKDIKWYIDWGTYETGIMINARLLKDSLTAKGYELEWNEWHEGHSWGSWRAHLDIALEYFFPKTVNVADEIEPPAEYYLAQNFPNPFNPTTKIRFTITEVGITTLKVYDILGGKVATLVNEEKPEGSYEVEFDATTLPSGVYFYRLQAGSFVETKKMILMK